MEQQSLIYSFVAREGVILADYTEFTGNFTGIAAQCLQKLLLASEEKLTLTYNCDGHTFNYLVKDGFTYCVVAVESVGRQIPIAFLERIKEDFTEKYGGGKAATAVANSLNKEFGSKLTEQMQYCVDHPEQIIDAEVEGVVMEDIEKVLDLEEKIMLLVEKTENLRSQPKLEKGRAFRSLESQQSALKGTKEKLKATRVEIDTAREFLQTTELLPIKNAGELEAVRRMVGFVGKVWMLGHVPNDQLIAFKTARPEIKFKKVQKMPTISVKM